MRIVIAQANTQWRQNIATIDTAAQNEANMEYAKSYKRINKHCNRSAMAKRKRLDGLCF